MNDIRLSLLDHIEIASPCSARWEDMEGDDRKRLCADCDLHVYNIAAMTRDEAESLIRENRPRLCAQIYRRPDGTILTSDCPVGIARLRQQSIRVAGRMAAALVCILVACVSTVLGVGRLDNARRLSDREPFQALRAKLNPPAAPVFRGAPLRGKVAGRIATPVAGGVSRTLPECETEAED